MSILFRGAQRASRRFRLPSKWGSTSIRVRHISNKNGQVPNPLELIYPEAPNKGHSDLATFLAYVERTSLDKRTTVYRGTHYEYTVADTLSQYGFFLKRVGGASDRGMDLLGTWTPPSTSQTIKVILQCKAGVRSIGPMYVRELKGALVAAPPGWRGADTLGLLVAEKPATKGVQRDMNSAEVALGYVCCSKEGELVQLLWNYRAQEMGLEGISVGVRHGVNGEEKKLVLMKGGKVLPMLEKTTPEEQEPSIPVDG
ncbi:hypothetical protein NCS57_00259400 [Fusarium keratoplasticum]|uniref:Uncharacterized protein n=1 Tax=Fusarium keratoplasticum TaxID=1328300 RepID=A0ACC0R8Q7_9HYPO|nr:hypothetical protein NCS57_00259400 [Fusarium keratoplasticum]KAI8679806.1 hypothetical protein NCS57_00259400 [Fusarium keratoplasticum]